MLRLVVVVWCALGVGCLETEGSDDVVAPPPGETLATVSITSDSVSFTLIIDAGSAKIDWHLKSSLTGPQESCAVLGIQGVQLDAIPASGPTITRMGGCEGGPIGATMSRPG